MSFFISLESTLYERKPYGQAAHVIKAMQPNFRNAGVYNARFCSFRECCIASKGS